MVTEKNTKPNASADEITVQPVQQSLLARTVIITADKGGTGKTTFTKAYSHNLIERNIRTLAYDCDIRNRDLERYYGKAFPLGVKRLNLSNNSGIGTFLDGFAEQYPVMLLHLPGGAGEITEKLESNLKLSKVANDYGYRLTFVSVLNRGRECLNSLRGLVEAYGDRADYVVVKNLYFGEPEKFRRFDNSKTKEMLMQLNAKVISLPELEDEAVDFVEGIDNKPGMTYAEAMIRGNAPISITTWVNSFLESSELQLNLAAEYLGL